MSKRMWKNTEYLISSFSNQSENHRYIGINEVFSIPEIVSNYDLKLLLLY